MMLPKLAVLPLLVFQGDYRHHCGSPQGWVETRDQAEFTPQNVQTTEGRQTTVYAVELSVDNPDGKLKPGMPVDVDFAE